MNIALFSPIDKARDRAVRVALEQTARARLARLEELILQLGPERAIRAAGADAAANPCPFTSTTEPLACTPTNPARKAWHKNDLHTFAPTVQLPICGGHGDSEVDFANATLIYAYFQNHGAGAGVLAPLDVDSATTAGDPWAVAKAAVTAARNAAIAACEDPSTTDNHHSLAQAACGFAARDFFKTFQ